MTIDTTDPLTETELDALAEESPTLAKVLGAQQSVIQGLEADRIARLEREEAEANTEIQDAVDTNPTLSAWQSAKDQTMWEQASRFDRALREMPEYANVSFKDRFAKVVKMTQSAFDDEHGSKPEDREDARRPEQRKVGSKNLEEISAAELGFAMEGKSAAELQDYIESLIR